MIREAIIQEWRSGKTAIQVAKEHMQNYNKEAKKKKESKITQHDALAFVEPIIFEFETKDWRKK